MNEAALHGMNRAADVWSDSAVDLTKYTQPTNLSVERAIFAGELQHGRVHLPAFEYTPVPDGVRDLVANAIVWFEGHDDLGPWGGLALRDLMLRLQALDALSSRDPAEITLASTALYGQPPGELLDDALAIAAADVPAKSDHEDQQYDAVDAAGLLQAKLAGVAPDWTVEVADIAAKVSVSGVKSRVAVRPDAHFSPIEIERLAVHEIGCHVQRHVSGRQQPLRFAREGLARYLATEEGLAACLEEAHGLRDDPTWRRYALRFVAATAALNSGWKALAEHLLDVGAGTEAFEICARIKRGIREPDDHGAWVKDHVYWTGSHRVADHLRTAPDDLPLLLSGKFGLEQMDAVAWAVERDYWRIRNP